jgi:tetratricopeptide (TPR) repeat protein
MGRFFLIQILLLISCKTEAQSSVLRIADSLYSNGNFTKAIENYKLYNPQGDVYVKLAKSYMGFGSYDSALLHYKLATEAYPEQTLIKYEYAKLLAKTKKYKEASILFEDLITRDIKNPNYHYELGLATEQIRDVKTSKVKIDTVNPLNNRGKAQQHFLRAYELDNTHQKTIFKLAKFQLIKRNYETSREYIDVGLSSYENNAALISLKAQGLFYEQRYHKAVLWFEKLLTLGENSKFIYEKLSDCYAKTYRNEEAIAYLKQALKFDKEDTGNLYNLGLLYEKEKDYKKAEQYISLSIKLENYPLDKEYTDLARVYNYLKQPENAIKAYNKALKENPDNMYASFLIVHTKADYYKDTDAKIKLYENFITNNSKSPFVNMAKQSLSKLKKEQFLKGEEEKQD